MASTDSTNTSDNSSTDAPKDTPRVDFYVTKAKTPAPQFALETACRIADKAFSAGHRIHICLEDANECEKLDALLWTFRDGSFIPHEVSDSPIENCPVTLSTSISLEHSDMLLNIAHKVPENFMRFQRIAEVINNQPESVVAGRERYRFYRENGLNPQHHEVS